jgi:hypothetical protein
MRRPLRSRVRRPLAVAATTALLLALTACGGDEPENASDEPSISESSDPAESDEPDESDDEPVAGSEVEPAEFVDDMMDGLEESTTAQMTMDMGIPGSAMSVEGQVDYTTDPVSMAMTMTNEAMGDQPMDFRLVDGIMYMNMGSLSNNKFFSFDLSDPKNLPPGMEGLQEQMDPLAAFEQFEPALTSVTFVGDEDVDGEELARYAIVLDTAKMESFQGMPTDAGLPPEIAYDLYFDDEFRVRQMDMTMDMQQKVETQVKFFDWGSEVDIAAPPANQVVDGSQMGQMAG